MEVICLRTILSKLHPMSVISMVSFDSSAAAMNQGKYAMYWRAWAVTSAEDAKDDSMSVSATDCVGQTGTLSAATTIALSIEPPKI